MTGSRKKYHLVVSLKRNAQSVRHFKNEECIIIQGYDVRDARQKKMPYALRLPLKKYISIKAAITMRAVNAVQGVSSAMLMATNE
jgi:hypothetical protein